MTILIIGIVVASIIVGIYVARHCPSEFGPDTDLVRKYIKGKARMESLIDLIVHKMLEASILQTSELDDKELIVIRKDQARAIIRIVLESKT